MNNTQIVRNRYCDILWCLLNSHTPRTQSYPDDGGKWHLSGETRDLTGNTGKRFPGKAGGGGGTQLPGEHVKVLTGSLLNVAKEEFCSNAGKGVETDAN
jgi:hypothetical protein